jgi:hypothetical protein
VPPRSGISPLSLWAYAHGPNTKQAAHVSCPRHPPQGFGARDVRQRDTRGGVPHVAEWRRCHRRGDPGGARRGPGGGTYPKPNPTLAWCARAAARQSKNEIAKLVERCSDGVGDQRAEVAFRAKRESTASVFLAAVSSSASLSDTRHGLCRLPAYSDGKVANRDIRVRDLVMENGY